MKLRIDPKTIKLGHELPWNLYNAAGRILFKRGFVVHTDVALNKLLSLELYRETTEGAGSAQQSEPPMRGPKVQVSPSPDLSAGLVDPAFIKPAEPVAGFGLDGSTDFFENLSHCAVFLQRFYEAARLGDSSLVDDFKELVKRLVQLQSTRPDECLAAIHLYYRLPQSLLQPIYTAWLCKILSDLAYIDTGHIEPLMAAALTANLGMYHYYDKLISSNEKLTLQQNVLINTHPLKSLMLLRGIGINDQLWLEVVEQHHERGDGSGYPKGLSRDDIRVEASLYGLADSYLGLIMPRAFRPRAEPLDAWQRLSKFNVADDDEILGLFLKYATIYPPGGIVELRSKEIALVLNRDTGGLAPTVVAFGDIQGNQHKDLKLRQTHYVDHHIVGAFTGQLPANIDLVKIYMIGKRISAMQKS